MRGPSTRWRRLACLLWLCAPAGCVQREQVDLAAWELTTDGAPVPVTLPMHLPVPDQTSIYRLTSSFHVPRSLAAQPACLFFPALQARAFVRIDGQSAEALFSSMAQPYRAPGPQLFCVEALSSGDHAAEVTVSHAWIQSGFVEAMPRFMSRGEGERQFRSRQFLIEIGGIFGGTWMSAVGFCYLVIFLLDRRRAEYGWFVAQAATAAYYPYFMCGATQWVVGTYDARLLIVMITAAPVVSVYFTHAYFKLGPVPRPFPFALGLAVVLCAIPASGFWATRWVAPVMVATVQLTVVYQLIRLVKLARERRANAVTFAAAWVLLGCTAWVDCAAWVQLANAFDGVRLASWGLGLFAMVQSVGLSREYFTALRSADERADRIEQETREVQRLNSELRRQIFERSKTLSEALVRLQEGPSEIHVGDVVGERYRVVRLLGTGGMGQVFLVERGTNELFALKVMGGSSNRQSAARFAREGQILAQVSHPNIVSIVDAGVDVSGHMFLVMELVKGEPLSSLSGRFGDVTWAVNVLRQLALGVAALHAHRVVHRDLKPANVMLDLSSGSPTVKVTDFGISTLTSTDAELEETGELQRPAVPTDTPTVEVPPQPTPTSPDFSDGNLTGTGIILGTLNYLAPELALKGSKQALPPSDIYSYGVIAYELLTNSRPFDLPAVTARARGVSTPPPKRLSLAGLPAPLGAIFERCVAVDPAARPSADEIVAAFS